MNKYTSLDQFHSSFGDVPEIGCDKDWVLFQRPEVALYTSANEGVSVKDWLLLRQAEGDFVSPNPFVDLRYYARRLGVGRVPPGESLESKYLLSGDYQNVSPHWLIDFDLAAALSPFIQQNAEAVSQSIQNNYFAPWFWLVRNVGRVQLHPLFNVDIYRDKLGKNLTAYDALKHFLTVGQFEGIYGTGLFDESWYRSQYEHLTRKIGFEPQHSFQSLFHHFCEKGMAEGLAPIPDFDREFYEKTYPDVAEAVAAGALPSAVQHYLMYPKDYRQPNKYFNPIYYMENNPNVVGEMKKKGIASPLEHFLLYGYKENLKANQPLVSIPLPENMSKGLFEKRAHFNTYRVVTGDLKCSFGECKSEPELSVIVPVYNYFEFTVSMLLQLHDELQLSGLLDKTQVIVVDNGSSDLTVDLHRFFENLEVLRYEEPLGYTEACKRGGDYATGKSLLFTNNDIELTRGCISSALEVFENNEEVGACGGKILLTDFTIQEAGSHISRQGGTAGFARGKPFNYLSADIPRFVDYISGCFLFVRKSVYDAVGGFDTEFSPGYFEETDLCVRISEYGSKILYTPKCTIIHYEYATYSKGRPPTVSIANMKRNQKKFRRKHSTALQNYDDGSRLLENVLNRKGDDTKKHVLIIDDLLPASSRGSGFSRAADIVKRILDSGDLVTLFLNGEQSTDTQDGQWLRESNCDIRYARHQSLAELLAEIGATVDAIWVARTHNIASNLPLLEQWKQRFPHKRLIGDTEVLDSVRRLTFLNGGKKVSFDDNVQNAVIGELGEISFFDQLLAVNKYEADILENTFDGKVPTGVLGHVFQPEENAISLPFESRLDFCFLGAIYNADSPNADSLGWFCNHVLPLIKKDLDDANFVVAGRIAKGVELPKAVTDSAQMLGGVPSVEDYLADKRVFVAPTRYAGGIPHKVQHAMASGIPCVITEVLANQMPNNFKNAPFVVAEADPESFAKACVELYTNETLWEETRRSGLKYISKHCNDEIFTEVLLKAYKAGV